MSVKGTESKNLPTGARQPSQAELQRAAATAKSLTYIPDSSGKDGGFIDTTPTEQGGLLDRPVKIQSSAAPDQIAKSKVSNKDLTDPSSSKYAKLIYHSANFFSEDELDLYRKTYRFGYFGIDTLSAAREYLFFTRPDLNIVDVDSKSYDLLPYYKGIPFWEDLYANRKNTIIELQNSYKIFGYSDPFSHLLQNTVTSGLDIPNLSASMIEGPVNDYGVGYSYRGSSESSDDNPTFSLEFKDNKWLNVYNFFKTYEMYETMKHHGQVAPRSDYIFNRVIHDQMAIYKFIVGEDMETIIYYGKMYGVTPTSLPRDNFSNATFDDGIKYSIDFTAAFYEDMIPDILTDFNALARNHHGFFDKNYHYIDVYNEYTDTADGRPAKFAFVTKQSSSSSPTGYTYKLKWKGDDTA